MDRSANTALVPTGGVGTTWEQLCFEADFRQGRRGRGPWQMMQGVVWAQDRCTESGSVGTRCPASDTPATGHCLLHVATGHTSPSLFCS